MSDAWLKLIDQSKLAPPDGDAWEHLNNQSASIVRIDGCVGLDMDVLFYDADVKIDAIDIDLTSVEAKQCSKVSAVDGVAVDTGNRVYDTSVGVNVIDIDLRSEECGCK